jgi:hypothetical protein
MIIIYNFSGREITAKYDADGYLEHVTDIATGKKMMVEYTQFGTGYEFTNNNGYTDMRMCNAVYVRIMDLDIFVPKFIFILNKQDGTT